MGEQWHDVQLMADDDAESTLWLSIQHEHYEPTEDCDLSRYLETADCEAWDFIFDNAPGYYQLRMYAGYPVMRAVTPTVLELPEANR